MNDGTELTTQSSVSEADMMRVLESSLYPGAKPASIAMVLAYCRAHGFDPLLKPVHIVPMNVKVGSNPDRWEWRDVVMPGINSYRIAASRSGDYAGKGEPVYGETRRESIAGVTVAYPEWCKVTVQRYVRGKVCEFTAMEFWLENFASVKSGAPNSMWQRRPFAQLAKCAEAQALRMAFPDLNGGYTADEMEGKPGYGTTIDGQAEEAAQPAQVTKQTNPDKPQQSYREDINKATPLNAEPKKMTVSEWLDGFEMAAKACESIGALNGMIATDKVQQALKGFKDSALVRLQSIIAVHISRLAPRTEAPDTKAAEGETTDDTGMWPPAEGEKP